MKAKRKTRTSISIPEALLQALDRRAGEEGRTRSDLVCEAVSAYFSSEEERLLAEGYLEMAAETPAELRGFEGSAREILPEW